MKINYLSEDEININNIFPLVVFDTETTGLKPQECEIIEVSAIKYGSNFEVLDTFSTYCRALYGIPEVTIGIHHITEEMLRGYEPFSRVAHKVQNFIYGCNIIGYNTGFDISFLEANEIVFSPGVSYIDVCKLAKKKYKRAPCANAKNQYTDWDVPNHKLTTMCDYFGIDRSNAHDSLADCRMTVEVFKKIMNF